jgi:hypothetical protein
MNLKEYYTIKRVHEKENELYSRVFELTKFNSSKQSETVGFVYRTPDNKFISDDPAFQQHKNEMASRRIRIVKKHLELCEPRFTVYWLDNNNINHFKA